MSDEVRKKNAADLQRAWKKHLKRQADKHGRDKNKGVGSVKDGIEKMEQ